MSEDRLTCAHCGEPFTPPPFRRGRRQKYCTPRCRYGAQSRRVWAKQRRKCVRCGQPVDSGAHGEAKCASCRVEDRRDLYERLQKMWHDGLTQDEMGAELGFSSGQVSWAVTAARNAGFDLARRYSPSQPDQQALRTVTKQFKREAPRVGGVRTSDGRQLQLREKQKCIIRILQAAPEPLTIREISDILCRLPVRIVGCEYGGVRQSLVHLMRGDRVRRVPVPRGNHYHAQFRWVVPALPDSIVLTLDDAQREQELAALISAQQVEQRRGHYAETDFRTRSLDAEFAGGGSFHDVLEEVA